MATNRAVPRYDRCVLITLGTVTLPDKISTTFSQIIKNAIIMLQLGATRVLMEPPFPRAVVKVLRRKRP